VGRQGERRSPPTHGCVWGVGEGRDAGEGIGTSPPQPLHPDRKYFVILAGELVSSIWASSEDAVEAARAVPFPCKEASVRGFGGGARWGRGEIGARRPAFLSPLTPPQ